MTSGPQSPGEAALGRGIQSPCVASPELCPLPGMSELVFRGSSCRGLTPGAEQTPGAQAGGLCSSVVVAALGTPASLCGLPPLLWAETDSRRWPDPRPWCLWMCPPPLPCPARAVSCLESEPLSLWDPEGLVSPGCGGRCRIPERLGSSMCDWHWAGRLGAPSGRCPGKPSGQLRPTGRCLCPRVCLARRLCPPQAL